MVVLCHPRCTVCAGFFILVPVSTRLVDGSGRSRLHGLTHTHIPRLQGKACPLFLSWRKTFPRRTSPRADSLYLPLASVVGPCSGPLFLVLLLLSLWTRVWVCYPGGRPVVVAGEPANSVWDQGVWRTQWALTWDTVQGKVVAMCERGGSAP